VTLLKADALDLPLVRLETVIGPGDGTTGAGQKRRPSKVGWSPKDALVLLGQMVPKVGVVEATLGAPTPGRSHRADLGLERSRGSRFEADGRPLSRGLTLEPKFEVRT
jgi:hypothetical protein